MMSMEILQNDEMNPSKRMCVQEKCSGTAADALRRGRFCDIIRM